MPSTTRGSILISTANDIGEALVEKLGGVGYSPNEWKNNINLCGIAPVDSAPALSVLSDSAGTGDERGSILIATADAIGAILNKKYNVLRGFKPKEWASAISKLAPLPERTSSGSIAHITDGADDVPTKSLVVTIPPTLSGVSAVNETQTGKNLLDSTKKTEASASVWRFYFDDGLLLKKGTYTISTSVTMNGIYVRKKADNTDVAVSYNQSYLTFTLSDDLLVTFTFSNINSWVGVTFQLEVGNQQTEHVPYTDPTTYTASLGRTIYGGEVDIVNGAGTDENGNDFTFTGQEINTRLGYNAFWSDQGNTALDYYGEPEPYARKTATGGIANFSDQRTDLPLTKAIANIAPSIAGKSAVNLYQGKKNLLNANGSSYTFQVGDNYRYNCGTVSLKKGVTYTFSALQEDALTSNTRNTLAIGVNEVYTYESATGTNYHNQSGVHSMQYTPAEDCEAVFLVWVHTPSNAVKYSSFMLEVGSSASAFEPYQEPTTYTAELGETVYGGSVDFVSGAKSVSFARVDMGSLTWQYDSANTRFFTVDLTSVIKRGSSGWITDLAVDPTFTVASGTANDKTISEYATTGYIYIKDTDYTDPIAFKASLSGKYLTYPLATPTESTIPGRVISPIEGVNNYWNDAGGDTEIQYFENET